MCSNVFRHGAHTKKKIATNERFISEGRSVEENNKANNGVPNHFPKRLGQYIKERDIRKKRDSENVGQKDALKDKAIERRNDKHEFYTRLFAWELPRYLQG